jgi:predicted transcriptional regulator
MLGSKLSRRERQIMDVVFRKGSATVKEALEGLPDPPSYSAVRALLNILETKGHLRHEKAGTRYLYRPVQQRASAAQSALTHVVRTFFDGSIEKAVETLVSKSDLDLSDEELDRLAALIEQARERERT